MTAVQAALGGQVGTEVQRGRFLLPGDDWPEPQGLGASP